VGDAGGGGRWGDGKKVRTTELRKRRKRKGKRE